MRPSLAEIPSYCGKIGWAEIEWEDLYEDLPCWCNGSGTVCWIGSASPFSACWGLGIVGNYVKTFHLPPWFIAVMSRRYARSVIDCGESGIDVTPIPEVGCGGSWRYALSFFFLFFYNLLNGIVVKRPLRMWDPCLRPKEKPHCDFQHDITVTTLLDSWSYKINTRAGWLGVSIARQDSRFDLQFSSQTCVNTVSSGCTLPVGVANWNKLTEPTADCESLRNGIAPICMACREYP